MNSSVSRVSSMRGSSRSVDNVVEASRLLRLERMKVDFYWSFIFYACILVLSVVGLYFRPWNDMLIFSQHPFLHEIKVFIDIYDRHIVYSVVIGAFLWISISGICYWFTSNKSKLSSKQLKLLGLDKHPIIPAEVQPQVEPQKLVPQSDPRIVNQGKPLSSSLPLGLASSTPSSFGGGFTSPPPTQSLLQQWYPASPLPSSSQTPQWQQYHSSPLDRNEYPTSPSAGEEISSVARAYDAFGALQLTSLSLSDDHKENLRRIIVRYLYDSVRKFDATVESIVQSLVSMNRVNPIERDMVYRVLMMQDAGKGGQSSVSAPCPPLGDVLRACRDALKLATPTSSFMTLAPVPGPDLVAEYESLATIFDLSRLSTMNGQHAVHMNQTKPLEISYETVAKIREVIASEVGLDPSTLWSVQPRAGGSVSTSDVMVHGLFLLLDSHSGRGGFSTGRYASSVAALPRSVAISPLGHSSPAGAGGGGGYSHVHITPSRGHVNVPVIVSKYGHKVGILCQKNNVDLANTPRLSLFIPYGSGQSAVTVLVVEKGRQNCITCLLLFLLVFFQSVASGQEHAASQSAVNAVTSILCDVFSVPSVSGLKRVLGEMGLHI